MSNPDSNYIFDTGSEKGRLYRLNEDYWEWRYEMKSGYCSAGFAGTAEDMDLTEDDKRRAIDRRKEWAKISAKFKRERELKEAERVRPNRVFQENRVLIWQK